MSSASNRAWVLVVEDDAAWARLLEMALADVAPDFDIERYGSTHCALARLQRAAPPCLVFLDLNLPDAPGIDVLTALRRQPVQASPVVVVLSASLDPRDGRAVEAAGATAYRAKPTSYQELRDLVSDASSWVRRSSETPFSTDDDGPVSG